MNIDRQSPTRKRPRGITLAGGLVALGGCGLLTAVMVCVGVFLLQDSLIGAGLELAGFESEGRTSDVLQAESSASNAAVIPNIVQPSQPQQFQISAGGYGQETVANNAGATLQTGRDDSGQPLATVITTESDVQRLCVQWSQVCSSAGVTERGYELRNASLNLESGGAIVSVEVRPPNISFWQQAGIVLQLDPAGTALRVRGVDINGVLYSQPPAELAPLIDEAERVANDAIRQLAISAAGEQYTLEQIVLNENAITLLLR